MPLPWRNWQIQIFGWIWGVPTAGALDGPYGLQWPLPGTTFKWLVAVNPKMFLQSQLLAEYLSTRSNCSFSEISRVSTWNKVQLKAYDRQYHLKSKKHHHDDGAWGGKTLPSEARGSSTVGVTGQKQWWFFWSYGITCNTWEVEEESR